MDVWFRRLLAPAPTSPTDFSLTWSDKRPKRKQVANGFRIVGGLIAGFVVMMCVFVGLAGLSTDQPTQSGGAILASSVTLLFAAIVMVLTVHRWAPFVTGLFFGPAVLKILGTLILEPNSYYSSHSTSRLDLAVLLGYSLAVVALTSRFVGKRPAPTTIVDRIALPFFVFASFKQLVAPYGFPWFLFVGFLALFMAWWVHHHTRVAHKRRLLTHDRVTSVRP